MLCQSKIAQPQIAQSKVSQLESIPLKIVDHFRLLGDRLRQARAMTPQLMSVAIAGIDPDRMTDVSPALVAVHRLTAAGAWTDAALALIDAMAPAWSLRRIAHDDGIWHCALSRSQGLPDWLDPMAEGSHETLALAILIALADARRIGATERPLTHVVRSGTMMERGVCCDNFS